MSDDVQNQILRAVLIFMRPIARILLRFGIGFREFSEMAKIAFVDVATKDHGLRGRPTNISRVAVMTGLTRKEVRRLRDKLEKEDITTSVKSTPLSGILHKWHSEPDFLDSSGQPAILEFADADKSFSELVKRHGGDIPPGAMRTELKRVSAIEELPDGKLKPIRRHVSPSDKADFLTTAFVHGLYPLASNIAHNLTQEERQNRWAMRSTFSQTIRSEDLPSLRRINQERLVEFSEAVDDTLMGYEALFAKDEPSSNNKVGDTTVLVGLYYFEENDPEIIKQW